MLSITPLGTSGLYPTTAPTSGYLVKSDRATLLLDLGSGVFASLLNKTNVKKLDALLISHFHFDHASDIGVLKYYLEANGIKLKVFAPKDDSALCKVIETSNCFDFEPIVDGQKIEINGLLLDFYQMNHPVITYGVKITNGKKSLCYTADTNVCDSLDKLLSGCSLAVMDSCFLQSNWTKKRPHLSSAICAEYGKKHNLLVLLSHFHPTTDKSTYLDEAKAIYNNCVLAEAKEYVV